MDIIQRKTKDFREQVISEADSKFKPLLNEFIDYWTEPNKSGTKIRYDGEKFFHVNRRLATWAKNQKHESAKIEVRAEVIKPSKTMEIETEIILRAYRYFKANNELELRHEEVWGFLYSYNIFRDPTEKSEKTGKTWANWYNKMKWRAKDRTIKSIAAANANDYKKERNQIDEGTHPDLWRYGKLECLKTWFKGIKTEQELLNKLQ